MNVEYTGRQYEVTPTIRKEVETGLTKIRKILGDRFEAKSFWPSKSTATKPKSRSTRAMARWSAWPRPRT